MSIRSWLSVAATLVAVAASPTAFATSSTAAAECEAAVQNDSRFSGAGHSGYSSYDYNGNRGGSNEYKRGLNDGRNSREFDTYKHPQDYKDGYRDGELARWKN